MKKHPRCKKTGWKNIVARRWRFWWLAVSSFFILHSAFAAQLNPVVAYLTDSQGNPYGAGTNVTITAWPPTNAITGVYTNLVANIAINDVTDAHGMISNNLVPGNYRMQIAGFPRGVIFGVVSNSAVQNLSQVAGVPVPTFLNFTLAQFSDAGTMAYENTNNWTRKNYTDATNALGFTPATNGGPVAISQLPYTPPTNSYTALTNVLGFVPATNGGPVAITQLPYTPPTNSYPAFTNVLGFIPATNGGPINPFTQLPWVPATNNGAINNSQLSTNVLLSYTAACVSIFTNGGIAWVSYQTNSGPGFTLTNLPPGSICTTTNGSFYVLSNATWLIK